MRTTRQERKACAYRKADRRLATALQSSDDALLHRARKAAKRARYAAELIKPTGKSESAKRKVRRYKRFSPLSATARTPS
ncbi:MAG TPA: CHAD domain-containing protein [Mycobacterium sp.]|nr:CHAD domain-containing protein [Mycobacterium sp.]